MKSEFLLAFNEICDSRGLSKDVVLEAIETALVSAFRRNIGVSNNQNITAKIDPLTGTATIYAEKEVVDSVQDDRTEVTLRKARREIGDSVSLGDLVMIDSTPEDFGRISAQTAKQVILQRIREAERDQLFEDFSGREGEIVNGTVQSVTPQGVTLGLGRTEALLPRNQQVPGERYYPHDKVRAYVLEVRRSSRGPQIVVSRSHRNMLRRMLELEVPEIYNGLVEIKSVAREAGQRSKVAVAALQEGVDPVGACVGMRGVRIQSIVRELNDEKIDVIEWNADSRVFIAKSLSPARVSQVYLNPESASGKTATVIVADDQLSLAIGREGQNARLAAKLTGWRIDIKSLTETAAEALTKKDDPLVADVFEREKVLVDQVNLILSKKEAERPITAEDYHQLNRFIEMVEGRFAAQAEAEQRAEEKARRSIAPIFWQMPINLLDLSEEVESLLVDHGMTTVGHIMSLLAYDPAKLQERAELEDAAFTQIQEQMATTEFPRTAEQLAERLGEPMAAEEAEAEEEEAEVEAETEIEAEEAIAEPVTESAEPPEEEAVAEPQEPEAEIIPLYEEPPEEIRLPDEEPEFEPEPAPEAAEPAKKPKRPVIMPARREEDEEEEDEPKKHKKGRKKRRHLVYNEDVGEVVSKRKRKRGRQDDYLEYGKWEDYVD
jgi:N utilization substance protein A